MDILSLIAWAITNTSPVHLGVIGDKCSSYPHSLEHVSILPQDPKTPHQYQIQIEDKACPYDILWGDSFHARVRLESAPVGLQLCVQMRPAQISYVCDKIYYEFTGSRMVNNTQDVSILIFWHPQAKPISGSYRLVISGI